DAGENAGLPEVLPGGPFRPAGESRPVFRPPIAPLLQASRGIGHNLVVLDQDGPLRRYVPFIRSGGLTVPALGVAGAIQALGVTASQVRLEGDTLWLGKQPLPLVTSDVPAWDGERRSAARLMVPFPGVRPDGRPT